MWEILHATRVGRGSIVDKILKDFSLKKKFRNVKNNNNNNNNSNNESNISRGMTKRP